MKLSSILPSKWLQRIIILVLAVVLVAGVVYTLIERRKAAQLQKEAGIPVAFIDPDQQSQDEIDDDNDGVPNWEERLWGLDPNNPDTDGDGVDDASYLKSKKSIQERRALGIENVETTLSESEKIGRGLYTALLAIEQSGGDIDDNTRTQISENITDYVSDLTVYDTLYLRENLNLVENSKENTFAYRDGILQILDQYPLNPQDIELIVQAIENKAPYESRIQRVSTKYEAMVVELSELNVPYVIAGRHTELLNNIAHISGTLKNLNQEEADNVVSLSAVLQMEQVLVDINNAIEKIGIFFTIISDESVFNEA